MTEQEKWEEVRKEWLWFLEVIPMTDPIDFGTSCEEDFVLNRLSIFIFKLRKMFPDILTRYHESSLRMEEVKEFLKNV